MKRLAFLVAGSAILLVAGASPALADNGPHVKSSLASGASGPVSGVTKCASCHRAHTAQAAMLLVEDQVDLCYTCHSGSGAATNVKDGVDANANPATQPNAYALRGGGFSNAAIGANNATAEYYTSTRGTSLKIATIPPLTSPVTTTSSHGMGQSASWGLGLSGGASGTLSSPLECGSCHDPHGNGNYRILTPVPGGVTNATIAVTAASVTSNVATITTASEHYLGVGSTFTLAGFAAPNTVLNGTWTVLTTASYTTLTFAVTTPDIASFAPAAATLKNAGSTIADATTKTYTTANYWLVNDEATPTTTIGTTANVASFIGNIAQWCTQCHTRYLTGRSGSYENPTSDPIYTYRHRSNSVRANGYTNNGYTYVTNQVNAANCIQCHVSHGSNAAVTGASAQVNWPGTTGSGNYEDSALLRISNRGTCQACHNK